MGWFYKKFFKNQVFFRDFLFFSLKKSRLLFIFFYNSTKYLISKFRFMKKILLVEDDSGISNSLKIYLENSNFWVEIEDDWGKVLDKIESYNPDLIILDLNLPWKDGIEITKEYRENWNKPIIMLTARSSELDRIKWLEIWADDYIAKPFSPRELLARINTILRRTSIWDEEKTEKILKYKDLELDLEKQILKKKTKTLTLTSNEYEIIKRLFEKEGWVLTREEIMKEVMWYEKYLYDRTVDTHIKNLRKKLWKEEYILTVRWVWYRFSS